MPMFPFPTHAENDFANTKLIQTNVGGGSGEASSRGCEGTRVFQIMKLLVPTISPGLLLTETILQLGANCHASSRAGMTPGVFVSLQRQTTSPSNPTERGFVLSSPRRNSLCSGTSSVEPTMPAFPSERRSSSSSHSTSTTHGVVQSLRHRVNSVSFVSLSEGLS